YFSQWKLTESKLLESKHELSEVIEKQQETKPIQITKGKKKVNIQLADVKAISVKNGVTLVDTETPHHTGIFQGTLKELWQILPADTFFPARRNVIIRRETVESFSSDKYGKIKVELRIGERDSVPVTISREKAASFRKWFNSDSAFKL
ncbi:MAG: LytTR family DNA-binding domain-containing protein, partial [Bacteroidota bacterium]